MPAYYAQTPQGFLFASEIKALLSGAGGDDIFTGYRRHVALQQKRYWAWLPRTARRGLSRLTSRLPTGAPALRRVRKAFEYAALDGRERLVSSFYWLGPDSVRGLVAPELRNALADGAVAEPLISALDRLPKGATGLDCMLYLEGKFFLADHNLNYTDKMSMAHGVEVRVPLLDRDLVALAARLPDGMKQRGRTGKWVFKKAMEPYLPHDVIYRPNWSIWSSGLFGLWDERDEEGIGGGRTRVEDHWLLSRMWPGEGVKGPMGRLLAAETPLERVDLIVDPGDGEWQKDAGRSLRERRGCKVRVYEPT